MTISPGDILSVVQSISMPDTVIAQNVFHFIASGTSTVTDAVATATVEVFLENFYDELAGRISSAVSLFEANINVMEFTIGVGWEVVRNVGTANPSVTFGATGDMLPHASAAVITADTSIPKRGSRKSIPGCAEAEVDNSEVTSTLLSALALAAIEWLTDTPLSATLDLVSSTLSNLGITIPLTAVTVPDVIGSQRRRKPGIGI